MSSSVDGLAAGPSEACRRDWDFDGRRPGLSGCDDRLLRRFVRSERVGGSQLYTHVPVGPVPRSGAAAAGTWQERQIEECWPWRVDAMVREPGGWTVIECKPDAGYGAIGQVLFYQFWLERDARVGRIRRVLVLTDSCADAFVEFGASVGVELLRLGEFSPPLRARSHF